MSSNHTAGKPIIGKPTLTVNPAPAPEPPKGAHHEFSVKEEELAGGAKVAPVKKE